MYLVQVWRPEGTVNHGILVQPVRALAPLHASAVNGAAPHAGYLSGRWTLVYALEGDCDEACELALYHMRQVRLALGKEMGRVQRLLVLFRKPNAHLDALIDREFSGLDVVVAESDAPFGFRGSIHLVDPLGNLIMHYPAGRDAPGMIKDLKRLLKLSKIG